MNPGNVDHEIVTLGLKLFSASCNYVEERITSQKNAIFFIESAWTVSRSINEKHNLTEILEILTNLKASVEAKKFPKSFFFNPSKYRLLAINVALDVFASMQRRYRGQHEDPSSRTFTVVF